MRWWLSTWVVTSAALCLWASSVEYGIVVAGTYIVVNSLGMVVARLREPPRTARFMHGLGWAAALQLPVALVEVVDFLGAGPPSVPEMRQLQPRPGSGAASGGPPDHRTTAPTAATRSAATVNVRRVGVGWSGPGRRSKRKGSRSGH